MKRKLFLPMFAIVFAAASAFASPFFVQKGWIDTNGATTGGGVELNIVSPSGDTPVCSTSATQHQCMVSFDGDVIPAYSSQDAAETANSAFLLKYN
jgi:peroxiredoxin